MSDEIENYIKELIHLKKLGLISNEETDELDELIEKINNLKLEEDNASKNYQDFKIETKFVNTSNNPDPVYAKDGDSGFDLRVNLPEGEKELIIEPLQRMLIPTGLYFELPDGYELQVRPRSGYSYKTGLMAILGTVDRDYRGEVKVIMINLDKEPQRIEHGDRIAQGVIVPRISTEFGKLVKLKSVEELSDTDRGVSGFGSTGSK